MAKDKEDKKLPKGIYKRGGIFWVRYAGLDGKTIFESSKRGDRTGKKIQDAETLLHERKAEIAKGKQPEIKRIGNHSFKDLSDEYSKWIVGRHKSEPVKKYIIAALLDRYQNVPLRRFNTPLVEQLQTELIGKGRKNSYINKVLNLLKAMINKAVEWEMVEEDVLKRVRKVKGLRENKRLRYLSPEECQKLLSACDELTKKSTHYAHLKPIVLTALNTGMRKGEILGLKWSNVDLKNRLILLDVTKNGERREVPINATLRDVLQVLPRRIDGGPVFKSAEGGEMPGDIKHSFTTACKKAGFEDLHFHDLRHTFASQLVMAGVDITTVKELLGHKDIKMTLRYAHLAPAHRGRAVEILDSVLVGADYTKTRQFGE